MTQNTQSMSHNYNWININFNNHKTPEFKEVKGKDWVYYGEKNNYPDYLIELSLRSAKHGAILRSKVNYIYGKGLKPVVSGVSVTQKAEANAFVRKLNEEGNLRRMVADFELFNGFYIEMIWNKAMTKVVDLGYIPFSKMRTNADESLFYYSNDWTSFKQDEEKTGYKEFTPFDADKPKKNQVLYVKLLGAKNGKDKNVYPTPEYIAGCTSIETDLEIANYHLNNVKTGFSVGTIISFNNGVPPTQEAKQEIEDKIKEKFQGTDKAGSVAIMFSNSSENAPSIVSFAPSDLDKQFIEISKRVEQDIFSAHSITSPMLFGIKTEGQLGGRQEMIDAFELFQSVYVDIRQSFLEQVFNKVSSYMGVTVPLEFDRVKPVVKDIPEAVYLRAYEGYSVDELIEILGLPKRKVNVSMRLERNDLYEVIEERSWDGKSTDEDYINSFKFAKSLTANERAVLDMLIKDELLPSDQIAKAVKISVDEVNEIIDKLKKGGYLTGSKGADIIEEEGSRVEGIEVRYKYVWRYNVPEKDRNVKTSREFCQELMGKTKNQSGWLRYEEILALNNGTDLEVWDSRGGWWNKNGVNLPYCRHEWKQVLVKVK
jgi:DNA-binding Lrp family transcriptional regulator